ncbi:DUF1499 domain-containing protein [Wenzhouxiangella limi]|uniref:DUF1499 domain-containing protein n=1 Tax=Wenzhouxiangella limi TaxID=2707351 RepID=A0A845VIE4_9GAMM|nr:DUF1499 domain-containing protein [Wenzhouxiangella limi]NDY96939.1 DUF1499 domain-containing protein [Wenzhouxiangella limi]
MKILARLVLITALAALLLLLIAGPGTRLAFWDFRFGFTLMRWAVYLGAASAVVALVLMLVPKLRAGRAGLLALSLIVGLAAAAVPAWQLNQARSLPRIHDITTDFSDPPAFRAIAPLRADAPNPPEYQGEEIASQQREAYPDIQPLLTEAYPAIVFDHALDTARGMGWEIVAAEPELGIIEATDTTFWFGFKDDVVVRISAEGDGSRVDVRSKSRVGLSDVGANAARIRSFMERLAERMN